MEEYIELNKCKKQLEYISNLLDVLAEENDGGLFEKLSEKEIEIVNNFYDFLNDKESKTKNKLKKIERKIKNEL